MKVYVEGRLQTRQWEDQQGQKRYTTELVANQVTNLDRRPRDESADAAPPFPGDSRPAGATISPIRRSEAAGVDDAPSDIDDLPF